MVKPINLCTFFRAKIHKKTRAMNSVRACKGLSLGLGPSNSSSHSKTQSRKWTNRKEASNEDQWRRTNVQQKRNEVWQSAIQSLEEMNEPNERDLIEILDKLSAVPYPDSTVDDFTAMELLMRLTKHIHASELVESKLCQLLTLLIGRQKVNLSFLVQTNNCL